MIEAGSGRALVVVGAGGHAKVLIDMLGGAGWRIVGCTSADAHGGSCTGVAVLGTDAILPQIRAEGVAHAFCALGDNRLRERVAERLSSIGFTLPSVAGTGAIVSASTTIGFGVAIMPGAVINIDTRIADLAIINTNANVDHDCLIGRAVHVGPGVAIAGEVTIGDRSFIGTGANIIPRCKIGDDCIVGAGSVVIRDLADGNLAFGNPARIHRPA